MAVADAVLPLGFVNLLRKLRPALKYEAADIQNKVAYLVWVSPAKSRRHRMFEDHMSLSYQELNAQFGRKQFPQINERLQIFTVSPNWSLERGETKAYKLVDDLENALSNFFRKWRRKKKHDCQTMIRLDGKQLITEPKAVASKDMQGITAKAWNRAAVANLVPIDLSRLKALAASLERMLDDPQIDLFVGGDRPDFAYRLDIVSRIILMAREVDGQYFAMQRYVESASGRLYGKDINLQTVPRSIKEMALHGFWEYDFENCHYSIIHQMALKIGLNCDAIAHYLANKREIRTRIQMDIGISPEQAKTCLISLIYGARFSHREEDAIPSAIGIEAAQRIYQHPFFIQLKEDIRQARSKIIAAWPCSRRRLQNDYGKWIRESDTAAQILAHLLQGVEAKMLETVRKLYPDDILLLQHDGFASRVQLDTGKMAERIYEATGFLMRVDEARIQISTDLGIGHG